MPQEDLNSRFSCLLIFKSVYSLQILGFKTDTLTKINDNKCLERNYYELEFNLERQRTQSGILPY